MRGSIFGKMITMTSFGESHGPFMGVVLDGIPSGLKINLDDLQKELDRRRPGKLKGTSSRNEPDIPEILSGIFEGVTLGTPIAIIVKNIAHQSSDYDLLKNVSRPGHADKTFLQKYGIRDHRGGGRSSGRETISRVIAGYFASLIIPQVKINCTSILPEGVDLEELKREGESVGGKVNIEIINCPSGLGEPVFDKLKADLAKSLLSIGGCTSFSYGLGEDFAYKKGSEVSDNSSNFGGIEGGISNGEIITLSLTFKPVSTIGKKAKEGRHDPCIIPRVIPVVESMVKWVIADHLLRQSAYEFSK